MEDNKMCGIYKITNLVNGKVYIGQTQDDIIQRWKEHKYYLDKRNQILYCAMRKYGFENFSFEILMLCEEDLLDLMEIYYIEMYRSYVGWEDSWGYNATTGGSGSKNFKHTKKTKEKLKKIAKERKHSDKTKRKMSESRKGVNNSFYGKHHTDESKRKLSESRKGKCCGEEHPFYGKHHTEEVKRKNSEAHKGENNKRSRKVYCNKIIFRCIRECAEYYNKNYGTMKHWFQTGHKVPQQFLDLGLRYATEEDIQNYPLYNKKLHGEKSDIDIYIRNEKRLFCDNMIFPSIKECSVFYKKDTSNICAWLRGREKIPQKFIDLGLRYATEEDIENYPTYNENIK